MWTIVRFALDPGGEAYRGAFELLARAGFERCSAPLPGGDPGAVLPAAVAGDALQDPAAVSRAIFDALGAAGLGPVAVTGCRALRRAAASALAPRRPGRENGAGGLDDPGEPR